MRKTVFIIMAGAVMLLTGCGKTEDERVQTPVYTSMEKTKQQTNEPEKEEEDISFGNIEYSKKNTDYKKTTLKGSDLKLMQPMGVCVFNNQVIVCDKADNKIVVLDMELNYVKAFKLFSPGLEELKAPSDVTVFEDKLYVLDTGNNRVLVLDSEFKIEDTIDVSCPGVMRHSDMAVDKDGILYLHSDECYKVCFIENGEAKPTDISLAGNLASYNGKVYALDSMEVGESGGVAARSGVNKLYRLNKAEAEELKELPYACAPTDFIFLNGKLVTAATSNGEVYRFTEAYEVEERLGYFALDVLGFENRMAVLDDVNFVITNPDKNEIYYFHY